MKTIITLIAFFTLSFSVLAQNHYIDSTSVWKETYGYFVIDTLHSEYYKHIITGDTIINSNSYFKIQQIGIDSLFQNSTFQYAAPINEYIGAIREDTTNKRIYIWGNTKDVLLYDFSLNIGDTIPDMQGWCETKAVIVSCIDTVIFAGQPRKRTYMGTYPYYMIEGIGSHYGLFGSLCQPIDAGGCLITYYKNFDSLFVNGCAPTSGCFATSLNNNDTQISFSIFPNPATNHLSITTKTNTPSEIIIYDVASRKLMEKKFIKEVSLNIAHLAKGVYLYQIIDERGTVSRGKVEKE